MNINFEYHAVKASNRLEILAADKLNKLLNKFDFVVRADVFFKTENTSQSDTGMICSIRLSTPGPRIFAESSNGSFEASISEAITELGRQLDRRKAKMKTY
jgi:putative sigma-54 modulation protein